MSTGQAIVAEGQHPDGTWEQDPPSSYEPVRFSIHGRPLSLGDRIELLIEDVWVPATFDGFGNSSCIVQLRFNLGHLDESLEDVLVPIDARFRLPVATEAA